MTTHIQQTIADLQAKLKEQEATVADTKKLINMLCQHAGMPLIYLDLTIATHAESPASFRSDQFYGQSLAGSIREILEMRRKLNQGPATVNEIYDALKAGGFKFETKDEDNAKRGLRVSLSKNTVTFHKLPTGKFGLLEWYPNAKGPKLKDSPNPFKDTEEEDDSAEESS